MNKTLSSFISAGLPVLPTRNKIPLIPSHRFLDTDLPRLDNPDYQQIEKCDIAIKTGNAQTKIECIDVDLKVLKTEKEKFLEIFLKMIPPGLYIESTPSGGRHIVYRCETVSPSQKLCFIEGEKRAVIETRGIGGYFVCAPSEGYVTLQGDIFNLPFIGMDAVDQIKTAARTLNRCPDKIAKIGPTTNIQRVYNARGCQDVLNYLISQGWTVFREKNDKYWLSRPGKEKGVGASLFKTSGYLYVFTSSTNFEPEKAYSPFEIMREVKKKTIEEMERDVVTSAGGTYIRDLIKVIRKNESKLKDCEKKEHLSDTLIKDMEKNGKFFRDTVNGYYFVDKKIIKIDLNSDIFYSEMFSLYGIVKTDNDFWYFFEILKNYALVHGEKTTIRHYCFNNGENVYVDNFDGTIWKIGDKDIDRVENGTDGVLFLKTTGIPVEWDSKKIDPYQVLFETATFEVGKLTKREQEELFFLWFLSIFFLKNNKPMCAVIGEKGSGKTYLFKEILFMFFGGNDFIKTLPEKLSDFWPCVTNNPLTIIDNADTYHDWVNDALASCATGGTVSVRKLYTTNDEVSMPITSFIGITSHTPKFTRPDIADRLLILNLTRHETFIPEDSLLAALVPNRNAFMSIIFETIKNCLSALKKPDVVCVTRMADFENFCRKIKPETDKIFQILKMNQEVFSQDSFTDLFYEYCHTQTVTMIEKTAHELMIELLEKAKELRMYDFKLTAQSIAQKIKRKFDFCVIEKCETGHNNKHFYRIVISCELKTEDELWYTK